MLLPLLDADDNPQLASGEYIARTTRKERDGFDLRGSNNAEAPTPGLRGVSCDRPGIKRLRFAVAVARMSVWGSGDIPRTATRRHHAG